MARKKKPAHEPSAQPISGQPLIYQDGALNLQVRLDGDTVWLTQAQIADLFQAAPQNITLHIAGIYEDHELAAEATCKEHLQVQTEGDRRDRIGDNLTKLGFGR